MKIKMKRCHIFLLLVFISNLLICIGCDKKTTAPEVNLIAPTLTIPANKTEYTSDNNVIQFSWEAVEDADLYQLQVSDDMNFSNIIIDEKNVANSSFELNNTIGEGIIYWRVSSSDRAGNVSEWSHVFMFLVNRMMDSDDNIYKIVKINNQWWLAENLKVTRYRNDDTIEEVTSDSTWVGLSTGARCAYSNNENNESDTYGYLYNWYAVDDSRNIAPPGWHVPTDEEWKTLEMAMGMSQSEAYDIWYRGTNEGSKLAGRADLWVDGNLEKNAAFDESGFSALPVGYRGSHDGNFNGLGISAYFWSATEGGSRYAWRRDLFYDYSEVYRFSSYRQSGFSIRLVRD